MREIITCILTYIQLQAYIIKCLCVFAARQELQAQA